MSDTLGDALPREMARVRDEMIPMYQSIGPSGGPAIMMMRAALDRAAQALACQDVIQILASYEELKGFNA